MLRTALLRMGRAASQWRSLASVHTSAPVRSITAFTDEENMMFDAVTRFSNEEIAPRVHQMDKDASLDPELLQGLFEQGLCGIEVPEKYGGAGLSFTSSCLAIEAISKVDAGVGVVVDVQNTLITNIVNRYGSEEQRQKWLPRLAQEHLGSFCLSEAGSGSDAFALKATAEKRGDEYVLNGSKLWITNAKEAGLFIVMARVGEGYKGITAFLVDRDTPGLEIGTKEDKLGIRASSTCEVVLNDVVVNKDAVLWEEGLGYKIAINVLNEGRIGIAAQMLGLMEGCFDQTMPYLHERKQFGMPIANFQGMQFQFADIATRMEAARLMVYNAARLKEAGQPFVKEAAMAKLFVTELAQEVTSKCIDWVGGVGFTREFPQEKFFRDAKIGTIYEGTSNLQLQTIARLISRDYE